MAYYSLRNDLILCNLRIGYSSSLRNRFRALFWFMLTCYRYDQAMAAVLAIEHYLEGPDAVFRNIGDRHKSVLRDLSHFSPQVSNLDRYIWLDTDPSERFASFIPPPIRTLACAWWGFVVQPPSSDDSVSGGRLIEPAHHHPLFIYGDNVVRVWFRYSNAVFTFRKDTRKAWALTRRFLTATFVWRARAKSIAREYADASYRHAGIDAWLRLIRAESPDCEKAPENEVVE